MQDDDRIFTDEQIGLNPKIAKQVNKCGFLPSIFKFIKKSWLIIVIILGVIGSLIVAFYLIPSINLGKTKSDYKTYAEINIINNERIGRYVQ